MASNNEEAKVVLASVDAAPAADIDPSLVTTGSPVEGGCVYTSFKAGAALPTDAVTKISTLTDLVSLGDLSTDGFTASKSITVNEFQGWHQSIVLTKVSGEKHQYKMVFIESVRSSVAKLRYGADNVETYEDGTFKQIKAVANSDVRVPLVIDELEDTGYLRRTVIPRVSIDSCDDVEHKPGGLVQYGFTFTVLKTADKPLFTIYRAKPAA